ncbi:hypothetical protein KP509_21G061100 [Ceratopteris richardii]|uniref:Kinesin motor domain-containing protein n=1 Tax=Ceratopteris richardii TaxID=49495 RepID=A0A8T2SAG4_CERRI|nr:hypothetical protein KP509_21G061100 [Ceratopteris richardii]KAH7315683.1 hypothetical protein KP509_21G061100 [Ceratopteris richardii]KAH7315684.1 hypothetical protein KP509_21G061100 [Ceratopteris richardii]KAH7315689.1 hypothetical protein KP509_21G061100 [Ceratopteris richardii]
MAKSLKEAQRTWTFSDSNVAWVEHICYKFVDTFMTKAKNAVVISGFRIPNTNLPCEALLKVVMAVLGDKNPEEVAMLVESMLNKAIKECSNQLVELREQGREREREGSLEQFSKLQVKDIDPTHLAARLGIQDKELKELKFALEAIRVQFKKAQHDWSQQIAAIDGKLHGISEVAAEYQKVAAENRELYNIIQELKGNIRVYCRVRPFLPGQNSYLSTVESVRDDGSIVIFNPLKQGKEQRRVFSFNKVFGPSATQERVFLDTQPLIRSVLDGYNVCIFAYGQTGSGKTYTMSGPNSTSQDDWGVNYRALNDLFEICELRRKVMQYDISVQMIEIYNEQVRDLFNMDGSNKKFEIRNNSQQNGLNVPDAKLLPVTSTEDVLHLMDLGQSNRAVGATALNERSSRSHSVLTVHAKGVDLASGCVTRGCLHLIDLAGSERVDKSEATGDRLKEAQHINKSLSALGDVIAALAQKSPHVPYRNSKLTQLLQDSLGGQAKTLMFVHISPDLESYGETMSTLKFAERVATVELGAAHANKDNGDVKELKNQVAFLKDALAKKDVEIELLQEEFRLRGLETMHDKQRAKALMAGLSTMNKPDHSDSPMDEKLDSKIMSSQDPPVPSNLNSSIGFYKTEAAMKQWASEAISPESQSSSGSVLVASPVSTMRIESKTGSKKNKIRHDSFDELDLMFPRHVYGYEEMVEVEKAVTTSSRNFSNRDESSKLSGLNLLPIVKSSSTRDLRALSLTPVQLMTKITADGGENYFTEDDETISSYSEADSWHTATTDHDMSAASHGHRRKEGNKGFRGQQFSGHISKKPVGLLTPGRSESPRKSGTSLPGEAKRRGGKAATKMPVST